MLTIQATNTPNVPVPISWGEFIDKITILEIKVDRISQPQALANCQKELSALEPIVASHKAGQSADLVTLRSELKGVNLTLWDIEDKIRELERQKDFGADFIETARSVYIQNDQRAALKKQINQLLGSELTEEKSYKPY